MIMQCSFYVSITGMIFNMKSFSDSMNSEVKTERPTNTM